MNGDAPDEYDLVDLPEDESADSEAPAPRKSPPPGGPGQPLPRMWKSDPDDEAPPVPKPIPRAESEPPPPRARSRSRDSGESAGGPARRTGLKPKPELNDKGEKKVLKEDTPVLDTYETRQRLRLATGGLMLFVVGLAGYIVYNLFIYDPMPMDGGAPDETALIDATPVPTKPDLEFEARAMLARAREAARGRRTAEAVALLEQLAKSYPNTRTAAEAQEALKRPSQNLPLFLEGPTVAAATPTPVAPTAPTPPPAVVDAHPSTVAIRGNVSIVAPVNPPEASVPTPTPPTTATAPTSPGEPPDRRLPAGFAARPEAGVDPSGWPMMIVGDRDGAPMVFVPGGLFLMGEDRDPQFASPEHKVRLSAYYIDQHEVTVGQYRRFLAETHYHGRPPTTWPAVDDKSADAMPMVMVNQADALAFAEWAGKALPTEAQWEAAARTTDGRLYPWGNDPPKYSRKRVPRQVDPIKSFPEDRSPYDVFDLAGNVLEWTADAFDRNYYQSLAGQITGDPTGPAAKSGKFDVVVKGGKLGAASSREPIGPEKRLIYVGFRCALQVEHSAPPAVADPATAPATTPPATNPAAPVRKRPQPAPAEPF